MLRSRTNATDSSMKLIWHKSSTPCTQSSCLQRLQSLEDSVTCALLRSGYDVSSVRMKRICQRVGRVAVLANLMAKLQLTYYAITMSFCCVSMVISICCLRAAAIGTVVPMTECEKKHSIENNYMYIYSIASHLYKKNKRIASEKNSIKATICIFTA